MKGFNQQNRYEREYDAVTNKHDHLTEEQFQALLDAQLMDSDVPALSTTDAEATQHLDLCQDCRKTFRRFEEVSRRLSSLKYSGGAQPEDKCPEEVILRKFVVQELPTDEAEELMKHITNCDNCAVKLREAAEDLVVGPTADEQRTLDSLRSSDPPMAGPDGQNSYRRRPPQADLERDVLTVEKFSFLAQASLRGWRDRSNHHSRLDWHTTVSLTIRRGAARTGIHGAPHH